MSSSLPAATPAPAWRSRRGTEYLRDVFVIGAGASVPYGMPTGAGLLALMRRVPTVVHETEPILVEVCDLRIQGKYMGAARLLDFHQEWVKQIKGSVILSIDQFLRNRTDERIRLYGKALMARHLLEAERSSLRNARDRIQEQVDAPTRHIHAMDWIQVLLSQVDLLENAEDYLLSTTFISFNYDRILEFFLRQFLIVERGKSLSEADAFIERMTILHLNGFLGPLSELPFGNLGTLPWHPIKPGIRDESDEPSYRDIAALLRTVWDLEAHVQGDRARERTSRAGRIFVLGTSFIPENLEAIGLGPPASQGRELVSFRDDLFATALGLSRSQIARAARLLGVGVGTKGSPSEHRNFREVTCMDLVTDELVL